MKKTKRWFTFSFYLFTLYSSCFGALVDETPLAAAKPFDEAESIKNNKLCETNPISKSPK